ncbi:helix-turn-helix transcriptional regulator [Burkholderia mallei]|uniref:helix-turn-helix transcriptional regulator n=1 Tax=Burkholderia mallei TaxID=13373 RepID=UPI000EAA8684|nr:LuxR family transcriptional regulator [Burkholderia mallei]RKO04536.1 LuxR family transcriptional regulator [Burkholderia mallei]
MSDIAVQEDAAVAASARPASRANPGGTARDAQTIEVVWCGHARRAADADPRFAPRLGVAEMLASARGTAECGRIATSLLRLMGFATFAYFALEFTRDDAECLYLHEAFTPAAYRGDYVRRRHHDVDPRMLGTRASSMPVVWDLRQLAREHAARGCDALDGFLRVMHDDDMCSGVMYSMPVPGTRVHAFASFTAPRRSRDWISSATLEQVLSLGLSVHRFAAPQLIASARERAAERLTPFERELLVGIAEGASDKEIGRRLDTSAHNVDYHLRKLRKRFGVANRIQLTYFASARGLI